MRRTEVEGDEVERVCVVLWLLPSDSFSLKE
jgi:hypothetical protein